MKGKVDFLGIGAQKTASTWVYQILEEHPETVMSSKKELDFFSYYYDHGFQWYEKHFENPDGERNDTSIKVTGEISPSYFCSNEAHQRAFNYNPDLKIVVSLREPIERLYSNHLHEIRVKHYMSDDLSIDAGIINNPMYIEQSLYFKYLKKWFDLFPRKNILVLFQENIKISPTTELKKIYDFFDLDLSFESGFVDKKSNISEINKYPGIDKALKFSGRLGRDVGLKSLVSSVKGSRFVTHLRNKNKISLRDQVPEIEPVRREELKLLFKDDVYKLAELLNDDIPWEY